MSIIWRTYFSHTTFFGKFDNAILRPPVHNLPMMINRHLEDIGETYGEHMVHAGGYGISLLIAGLACIVHAILPWLFETKASQCITRMHAAMSARRATQP